MSVAERIEEQAARWLLRREESEWSDADQAGLETWLDESMAHKAAYWRLEHGWRAAGRIAALGETEEGGEPDLPAEPSIAVERAQQSWWQPLAIAASLMFAIGLGSLYLAPGLNPFGAEEAPAGQRYATAIGGRKVIALPDGSRVELNTATIVRASVRLERREFWLDRGEAYFEIAHAPDRPFVVHAGSRTITVLGTRFSVRRDGDRVSVAVVEGRVRIEPAGEGAAQRSATIVGGDVAIAEGPSTLVAANSAERVESGLAWRQGMLAFDQSTLAEAAAEFNRYNRRQIVITDPEAAGIRIGGTFEADNVDAFVRLLRDAYGLEVEVQGGQTRISA